MNRSCLILILPMLAVCAALAGCGGSTAATTTGTGSADAVSKTADTTTVVVASPSPTPCPEPSGKPERPGEKPTDKPKPIDGAETPDGKPGDPMIRPVRGTVQSVDAAALSFVIAPAPRPAAAPEKGASASGDKPLKPAMKPTTVTVAADTVFVRKNGKETADTTATFAELATNTEVAVIGECTADTVAATRVELLPAKP